jgi:hypothetical protein
MPSVLNVSNVSSWVTQRRSSCVPVCTARVGLANQAKLVGAGLEGKIKRSCVRKQRLDLYKISTAQQNEVFVETEESGADLTRELEAAVKAVRLASHLCQVGCCEWNGVHATL